MRFDLAVEDTPRGIRVAISATPNGCTDHAADSLSCMIAARVDLLIAECKKAHAIVVEDASNTPCKLLTRKL